MTVGEIISFSIAIGFGAFSIWAAWDKVKLHFLKRRAAWVVADLKRVRDYIDSPRKYLLEVACNTVIGFGAAFTGTIQLIIYIAFTRLDGSVIGAVLLGMIGVSYLIALRFLRNAAADLSYALMGENLKNASAVENRNDIG